MIKFFRFIRQRLLTEHKFSKYLMYAIGEIVLVVIGILIALQINNDNEKRKDLEREANYLRNLKADLVSEIQNNDYFAAYRFEKAMACATLLQGKAPNTVQEIQQYTDTYETVFVWKEYVPNNNTFKELLSSGNLSLIKNDLIKNRLLELEKLYAGIATGEHHMRREYEAYLYDPHVTHVMALGFFDLTKPSYGFPERLTTEEISDEKLAIMIDDAQWQHNDKIFKNGLRLAQMNNGFLAGMHKDLVVYIKELTGLIDKELNQ